GGTHYYRHKRSRVLPVRKEQFRLRIGIQTLVLDVAGNSNDLVPDLLTRHSKADAFADCLLVGPEAARERLINNDDSRRILAILLGECAALQQGNAHCFEIRRRDSSFPNLAAVFRRWDRLSFLDEASRSVATA